LIIENFNSVPKKKNKKIKNKKKILRRAKRKVRSKKIKRKITRAKKSRVKIKSYKRRKGKVGIVTEEKLKNLIDRGRGRGFITESEILQAFPNIEQDISGLEHLYRDLESANIKVVSAQERLTLTVEPMIKKKKTELGAGILPHYDSVQMYLREIGKVPLLRGIEEVETAKDRHAKDPACRGKMYRGDIGPDDCRQGAGSQS